ncbi:MAG: hypothetical protein C0501_10875 [Isosphaera sp.]|nr:hypothetical protein [Isosphaera sp.]
MPIRDHFRPPVGNRLPWESLFNGWASGIADVLNGPYLPEEYVGLEYVTLHGRPEVDARSFSDPATASQGFVRPPPPPPHQTRPMALPDSVEVRVRDREWKTFVAAVVLVTPANKGTTASRLGLAARCVGYLQRGMGVAVVVVVTTGEGNIHNDICGMLGTPGGLEPTGLYAEAYRPALRQGRAELDIWVNPFSVGDPLPTMPLRLIADYFVPVELEATYMEACRRRRLIA